MALLPSRVSILRLGSAVGVDGCWAAAPEPRLHTSASAPTTATFRLVFISLPPVAPRAATEALCSAPPRPCLCEPRRQAECQVSKAPSHRTDPGRPAAPRQQGPRLSSRARTRRL